MVEKINHPNHFYRCDTSKSIKANWITMKLGIASVELDQLKSEPELTMRRMYSPLARRIPKFE